MPDELRESFARRLIIQATQTIGEIP